MKARIKATGEIVEVRPYAKNLYLELSDKSSRLFRYDEVDNPNDLESYDYWTKLEHQYAGMAMQTMLATLYNPKYHKELMACYTEVDAKEVARLSKYYAHTLVEKMKEKEE